MDKLLALEANELDMVLQYPAATRATVRSRLGWGAVGSRFGCNQKSTHLDSIFEGNRLPRQASRVGRVAAASAATLPTTSALHRTPPRPTHVHTRRSTCWVF